jgi:dipeptidyl aminopeptidase/acylaminoacyl peptidase
MRKHKGNFSRPALRRSRRIFPFLLGGLTFLLGAAMPHAMTSPDLPLPPVVAPFTAFPGDALPSLSAEETDRIEQLLEARSPRSGVISPDGQQLFFDWAITGVSQVWRIDGPRRFPIQMTGGRDAAEVVDISPDGEFLVVQRDADGREEQGIYWQLTSGGELHPIFHRAGVQAYASYISADSRYIYFSANALRPEIYTVYRYDRHTNTTTIVLDRPGQWFISDVHPDGRLLLTNYIGNYLGEIYEFEEATGTLRPIFAGDQAGDYRVRYGASPGEWLVLTSELSEFPRLYRYRQGQFQAITPAGNGAIERFGVDAQRDRIIYEVNDRGYVRVQAMDARTLVPLPLPAFAGAMQVRWASMSRNGRFVVLLVDRGKAPPVPYVWDWQRQQLTPWTESSVPEKAVSALVTPTLESYRAQDGTPIPMWVWRSPDCDRRCPVVVHFHGGPESQSQPGFNVTAQLFTEAGFVYVEPNIRGSSGYGKTWLNADNGARRLEILSDIADCAHHWRSRHPGRRIGVMGWSYGGYAALIGMTKFAGSYDAGVSVVGMGNLVTFLENTAPYRRQSRVLEYGDPVRDRETLLALSPITYVDRLNAPLLLIQGANDPRVPLSEAWQLYGAVQERGIPTRLIVFPDEGHGSVRRRNAVLELGYILRFFRQHLGSDPGGYPQSAHRPRNPFGTTFIHPDSSRPSDQFGAS